LILVLQQRIVSDSDCIIYKKKQSVVCDYDHPCVMRATTFDLIVSSHDKEGACMMSSVTQ
jgi:hypothetical protein